MKRKTLQFQTVKPILRSTLERLMQIDEFNPFRLVGGTSLSLRYGHFTKSFHIVRAIVAKMWDLGRLTLLGIQEMIA